MLTKQGVAITFHAFYVNSTDLDGEPGLTVTVDIYEATTGSPIVTAGNATELGGGLYYYTLASGSVDNDGAYTAIFKTASADVVQKWIPVQWQVGTTLKAVDSVTNGVTLANGAITAAVIATDAIDADAVAADAVTEIQNGLATSDQLNNIASVGAAVNTIAESFTKVGAEPETNTYAVTRQDDAIYHIVEDATGTTDCYYQFDVGLDGVTTGVVWNGYINSQGDTVAVFAYNWEGGPSWDQIGSIAGASGTVEKNESWTLTTAHVGTGANVGKARIRFYSTTSTHIATDRILLSYAVVSRSVGYADGSIWVDTTNGVAGTVAYINGTADKPVLTWADALTLATNVGIHKFHIIAGSSITLTAASTGYTIVGNGLWTLALGGQDISNSFISHATVSGTGTGSDVIFDDCQITASTEIPPSFLLRCGIVAPSGSPLTANSAGQYVFVDCVSLVPGSGTPYFDFTGTGSTTGVNFRRWSGGTNITLDADCVATVEVVTGGGQTLTTGGGNAEIRGICRSVTVTSTGSSVTQIDVISGPVTVNGDGGTVNIYGVTASVTDNSAAAVTITDESVSQAAINAQADIALVDYDAPTNTEMIARTLVAADYFDPANDAVANVTLVDTTTDVTNGVTLANDAITSAKYDESTAFPLAATDAGATQIARVGADSDTLETLSDEIAALNDFDPANDAVANVTLVDTTTTNTDMAAALTAAQVWAYATRTLTANVDGITVISAVSGSTITVYANDTWSFTVTDSSLDTDDYETVSLTVKEHATKDDDDAILNVRSDTGLIRIGKAAPTLAGSGSITYTTTSFTALIDIDETDIEYYGDFTWWLKGFDTTPVTETGFTLATGTFTINRPGLQAIT